MSRYDTGAVRRLIGGLASKLTSGGTKSENITEAMQRVGNLGMSPRQMMLNRLWAWYRCEQYAARRVDWNGKEVTDPIEHEQIASQGFIPPGFYDAASNFPIKFRKPTAPYALVRVIVNRFTGLLFSERSHPKITVDGDEATEDLVNALIEDGRLWPTMIQARAYGGAMGTVGLGFQFVNGSLEFEVHDPRWCSPVFEDRSKLTLAALEKRYMYPVEEVDPITKQYETVWYWYRRLIDSTSDILFEPVPVGDGEEPLWVPKNVVMHDFGFCPVVWVQNLPVQDDMDGDPDCLGVYELVDSIDQLLAQANKGVVANSDPTLILSTDAEMDAVRKGSDNAIKLPNGGNAQYLELQGTGPKAAVELAMEYRKIVMEVAQVVLEHPDVTNRTATEIERVYSSMITKADVMREQYGEKGIKPLLEMVLAAVVKLQSTTSVDGASGDIIKSEITLPPRLVVEPTTGAKVLVPREAVTPAGILQVTWPSYFEPMLADVEVATRAAIAGKAGGLIDQKHAVEFIAGHFRVEDVAAMIINIANEKSAEEDALAEQALGMLHTPGVPSQDEPPEPDLEQPPES